MFSDVINAKVISTCMMGDASRTALKGVTRIGIISFVESSLEIAKSMDVLYAWIGRIMYACNALMGSSYIKGVVYICVHMATELIGLLGLASNRRYLLGTGFSLVGIPVRIIVGLLLDKAGIARVLATVSTMGIAVRILKLSALIFYFGGIIIILARPINSLA